MATKTRVSLEEFLARPETEPASELIDGEVVQKRAPSLYHSSLVLEIGALLRNHLKVTREARVDTELRHIWPAEDRVFLPDVSVTLKGRVSLDPALRRRGPIPVQPDLAIEVLSPDDQAGRVFERADFYMRSGVTLAWFVDPDSESITIYRPGRAPPVHRSPAVIDAQPVLQGFTLDLAALFAVLYEDDE